MGGGRGGGKKRGRTQRRHFKQSSDNVWRDNPKKSRPDDSNTNPDGNSNNDNRSNSVNPSWQKFETQNLQFEEYYKEQGIVPENEWDEFVCFLRRPLPAAFRIIASGLFYQDIKKQLEDDFMKCLQGEHTDDVSEVEAIRPLPWYPDNLAWHLNFSRMQLRKNQTLERFHEFLKLENEVGNITRQEAVSMVPPLFLDVLPDHYVLDMCAAPGSKTFQLLEMIHQSIGPGTIPKGLVIANDVDVQRCNLLIHQTKRMCTANLIVTNHEAQHFPSCLLLRDCLDVTKVEHDSMRKQMLQFDRVLCDVPCSGDGTLRKAPDIWRKWNAGMGNGLHRLQVEIAMRGIALLKISGRMVYSTCSMNPVENEAVVAEILRRSGGAVELLDVSGELPELVRRPGLQTWKVRDKGIWLTSYEDVPEYRRGVITTGMFPSSRSSKDDRVFDCKVHVGESDRLETGSQDINSSNIQTSCSNVKDTSSADVSSDANERKEPPAVTSCKDNIDVNKAETSGFPLERCMRIVPHDQNSGAFFIAVLKKLSSLEAEKHMSQSQNEKKTHQHTFGETAKVLETKQLSEVASLSEDNSKDSWQLSHEPHSDTNIINDQASETAMEHDQTVCTGDLSNKDKELEVDHEQDGRTVSTEGGKGKLQFQGKWRGVDPVVFFKDEATINSIKSFYGIKDSFKLERHLVTRNSDANHAKRIYYVSESVHNILQLNFQAGQRLKITSLGLKVFERQSSKDPSAPRSFRLSSEGLPLLLPSITKQILFSSLADFRHLLQYRSIKFADFVDADFGERASRLISGCCVIVLNEGNLKEEEILADVSTISIVGWKGKTNISIMVSQLDAKELLERLSIRFGPSGRISSKHDEITFLEAGTIDNAEDINVGGEIKSSEDVELAIR